MNSWIYWQVYLTKYFQTSPWSQTLQQKQMYYSFKQKVVRASHYFQSQTSDIWNWIADNSSLDNNFIELVSDKTSYRITVSLNKVFPSNTKCTFVSGIPSNRVSSPNIRQGKSLQDYFALVFSTGAGYRQVSFCTPCMHCQPASSFRCRILF